MASTGASLAGVHAQVTDFVSDKGKDIVQETGPDDFSDFILVLYVLSIFADEFNKSELWEQVEIGGVCTGESEGD